MIDRETLARMLHESGRKPVELGSTIAAEKFGEKHYTFVEWNELSDRAKEGKRMQADFLLENLYVEKPEPQTSEDEAVAVVLNELHRAQAKHPGRMVLRHQAWGVIEEEQDKFRYAVAMNDYVEAHKRLTTTAAMCIRTLLDWPLIRHVEDDLTILHRLEPSTTNESEA